LKTLLVTNDFPPKVGGIQTYLWELWRRLDPTSTSVLTARSHPDSARFDAEARRFGLRIDRVDGRLLFFPTPAVLRAVRAACDKHQPDLVLLDPVWPLGLLGPRLGIPFGVILHGAEVAIPARLPMVRRRVASTLASASLVISAGHYPVLAAERSTRAALGHVVEIPPGVDCARFERADTNDRARLRRTLGLPEDALVVSSVSRLVPRKGMDVLVEAAARLRPAHPELVVAIAGAGRDEGRLRRAINRRAAPVRLLGRVSEEEKSALLAASDVFVMACRNRWGGLEQEGFGIVFLEAAASGVPQVAGDSGGAAEAVADGETGLVVKAPDDPSAVATALARLLDDEPLRKSMGAAARTRARTCFDYGTLAPRLAEALGRVAG
jgi:phosphatidyl-myo-inositol dimannoside synthase